MFTKRRSGKILGENRLGDGRRTLPAARPIIAISCRGIPDGKRSRLIGLILVITLGLVPPAWAWGFLGHRAIGRFAESRLTPKAKAAVARILATGETLADASTWADEHRRDYPKSSPWHYVDVPLDEPHYHSLFSGDNPERGYIIDKIHDFKVVVRDKTRPIEERRIALRFLIHFIEDLHMPMHVGDNNDKGAIAPRSASSMREPTCTVSGTRA